MITAKNLNFKNKIYYPDITIAKHTATFVVGKNGSGKSTLFKLLNRTSSYNNGEITFENKALGDYDPIVLRKQMLLVAQSVFLFNGTIKQNFDAFYTYTQKTKLTNNAIRSYLDMTNAPFGLNDETTTMSGGERQRVYLAIYLSFNPKVLLLDEPTSALDKDNATIVMKNILAYCTQNSITPIIISHNEKITERFADEIVRL